MIAIRRLDRHQWAMLLLALLLHGTQHAAFANPPERVQDFGLPQLMAGMQALHSASTRFVERKFVHMLNQPLQSSGMLSFVAPDRLQKQTLAPAPASLTVEGDRLTVVQPDGKTRTLSLADSPEIGALVASIRATLAGDTATLTRYYAPTLTGGADDWSLLLEPRDERLRKLLTMIRIKGEGSIIRSIETVEHDGDRTEMTIMSGPG
jgi:outer membrane lipoprotein-sorting protein